MKATTKIIIANIFFFMIVMFSSIFIKDFFSFFKNNIAFTPSSFVRHPWTIITSMFMHSPSTLFHLFANMLSLLFLGSFLEKIMGQKRFLILYFAGGIAGALLMFFLYSVSNDPRIITLSLFASSVAKEGISAVGASAAIFALAGCLAVLVPNVPVLVFFFLPMRLWQAIIFLMIVLAVMPGIANSAHLGGLLVGFYYALFLRKKYKKGAKKLRRMFG